MAKIKQLLFFAIVLTFSFPYRNVSALENTIDITDANQAFDEMKDKFETQKDNYGNIEIWDEDEIYSRYQREIRQSTRDLNIDKKMKDFKNHEYEGYGTISKVSDKISSLSNKATDKMRDNFESDLGDADIFMNTFKEKQDDVGGAKETVAKQKEETKNKYLDKVSTYDKLNAAISGGISSGSGGSIGSSNAFKDIFSLSNVDDMQALINEYKNAMLGPDKTGKDSDDAASERAKEQAIKEYKKELLQREGKKDYICGYENSTMDPSSGIYSSGNSINNKQACQQATAAWKASIGFTE